MKGHIGGHGLIGDVSQDKEQDNIATEDDRIKVVDQDVQMAWIIRWETIETM